MDKIFDFKIKRDLPYRHKVLCNIDYLINILRKCKITHRIDMWHNNTRFSKQCHLLDIYVSDV